VLLILIALGLAGFWCSPVRSDAGAGSTARVVLVLAIAWLIFKLIDSGILGRATD
jgi:hypothetical protein